MTHPDGKSRRYFLKASSALGMAAALSPRRLGKAFAGLKSQSSKTEGTMPQASAAQRGSGSAIRPFHVSFSQAELTDLRGRINAARWPKGETVRDATQGVQLATIQKLAHYWATDYDWRKCEAKLKALPHYVTEIDGLDIHFIHVRSKNPNALPIIVTHGWPGSIIEQLKIIGPLTDPTAFGGKAEDSFDVVREQRLGKSCAHTFRVRLRRTAAFRISSSARI